MLTPRSGTTPAVLLVIAGLACQECHGPVQEMDRVYQFSSLKMGWCVTCHRKNLDNPDFPASMDCLVCHH